MKTYSPLLILLAGVTLCPPLCAQVAPPFRWEATYTLAAQSGSVSCGPGPGTCTVSQGVTANPNFDKWGLSGLMWSSNVDNVASASMNDIATFSCAPSPGTLTEAYVATGTGASSSVLTLDPSGGTYTFNPSPYGNVIETISGCTSGSGPGMPALFPISNWPQTFSLPPTVQPLTVNNFSFTGDSLLPVANLPIPWTFSFTLTPTYNDDCDCHESGGEGAPVSSSIGYQSQSLGEDVPIVGTGFNLHYESERTPGADASSAASAYASTVGGWTLSVHHAYDAFSNALLLGDGGKRNGYQLGGLVLFNNNILITSEDGSEVYVFSLTTGQHLQTVRPLTGALLYQFGYDGGGKLVTVTDANGNVTTIQRDSSEHPTAIVSPYGQSTTLSVDANGFLSRVTDPLGKSQTFTNGSTGLLASRTDRNGNIFSYRYDGAGRLTNDADSLGGFTALTRTEAVSGFGWTAGETTSMGRTSSYQTTLNVPWVQNSTSTFSKQHTNTWPNGLQATSAKTQQGSQISESVTLPDGTSYSDTLGPDPVWGLQVPVETSQTLTKGNLTMHVSGSRTGSLGTPGNPFSLTSLTDTTSVNFRTYTSNFTASNLTSVDTTPVGRALTTVLDSQERVASIQIAGLLPTDFAYDSRGRFSTVTQGTRISTFTYDSNGNLATATDPLGLERSFTYDADGHLLTNALPDGRVIAYSYDNNGNLTSVTAPGESAHSFAYTAVNEVSAYTPPAVSGTGATTYAYDLDRDITKVTRPDGNTIGFNYDSAGRVSSLVTPTETINYSYDPTTGNLSSTDIANGEALSYGYNGPLPTSTSWTGAVNGSVSRTYNNNFWVTSQSINGGNTIAFTYDNDGFLTQVGQLALTRSPQNGLITGTTLGVTADSRSYNGFGELIGYAASSQNARLFGIFYTRDADGRITNKTEIRGFHITTHAYSYDPAGRLIGVSQNGSPLSSYTYDSNSNRVQATTPSGSVSATYDAQDRLLTYGDATYTYTPNGELASRTAGGQTTMYQYDVLGNLTSVTLPSGKAISYVVDAENRRVGKMVNGTLAEGFLYDGDRIVAQVNGNTLVGFPLLGHFHAQQLRRQESNSNASNGLVSQFIYASHATSPDYMISGGVTYRIFSDHLGSPLLVVNTSTGVIAEQITYDEFGNVLSDTNPGFQPFGFAGGVYDQDTNLIRFGARDYDPSTGRWTAKDPISFDGGDTNLYGYVLDDPVNGIDPSGLQQCTTCKLKEFKEHEKKEPPKSDADEVAKDAGKKIGKMVLKNFGKSAEQQEENIREGIKEETTPPSPSEEYKQQLDRAKERCDDSVDPLTRKLQGLWKDVINALSGKK